MVSVFGRLWFRVCQNLDTVWGRVCQNLDTVCQKQVVFSEMTLRPNVLLVGSFL